MRFLGIDLGWQGKPSGVACLEEQGGVLRLVSLDRLATIPEVLAWVKREAGQGPAVAGVDAPTVIANKTGQRPAERELNAVFRKFDAGCHPANLGRPWAKNVLAFSAALRKLGFADGANLTAKQAGRFQIEVHPHAATVRLFGLQKIFKYKKGRRADRAKELTRLREYLLRNLPHFSPPVVDLKLPELPQRGPLKVAEDQIDAVTCAYVAAHHWMWGQARNTVFGDNEHGFLVVPHPPREEYERGALVEETVDADPIRQFDGWFQQAITSTAKEPSAMSLATSTKSGAPSVRIVLLKGFDERGFVFYTNYESRKGEEIAANPQGALAFFWAELERQVRVVGRITKVSKEESEVYFLSRPLGSRMGASVSRQSTVIASRAELEGRLDEFAAQYAEGGPPRPNFWGGYRLAPVEIEFWQGRRNRLHDRLRFLKQKNGLWKMERLSP